MSSAKKMPKRLPTDGAVGIRRVEGHLVLACVTAGTEYGVPMSPHNAWRAFGLLALMLDIRLPRRIGKLIELGEPLSCEAAEPGNE